MFGDWPGFHVGANAGLPMSADARAFYDATPFDESDPFQRVMALLMHKLGGAVATPRGRIASGSLAGPLASPSPVSYVQTIGKLFGALNAGVPPEKAFKDALISAIPYSGVVSGLKDAAALWGGTSGEGLKQTVPAPSPEKVRAMAARIMAGISKPQKTAEGRSAGGGGQPAGGFGNGSFTGEAGLRGGSDAR